MSLIGCVPADQRSAGSQFDYVVFNLANCLMSRRGRALWQWLTSVCVNKRFIYIFDTLGLTLVGVHQLNRQCFAYLAPFVMSVHWIYVPVR